MIFAPYADLIWLETKTPDLEQARSFARKIREKFPGKWFVYNLSPSFNWSAHGFSGKWFMMDTWPLHWELFHRCEPQELYLGISQRRVSYVYLLSSLLTSRHIASYCSWFHLRVFTAMPLLPVRDRIDYPVPSIWVVWLAELAARYKTDGMLAYVELIQRREKEMGCDVLTHQKWCEVPLSVLQTLVLLLRTL